MLVLDKAARLEFTPEIRHSMESMEKIVESQNDGEKNALLIIVNFSEDFFSLSFNSNQRSSKKKEIILLLHILGWLFFRRG